MVDRLSWRKEGQKTEEFQDGLITALVHSGVCMALQDAELNFLFIANLPGFWVANWEGEPDDVSLFGEDIGATILHLKQEALKTGTTQTLDTFLGDHGEYEIIISPITNRHNQLQVLTTLIDMTKERQRERLLKTLLREVSHRSKNILAIVLGLASQTQRQTEALPDFLKIFRGKIYSLSASQDLITESNWRGAHLFELARLQAEKYGFASNCFAFSGDDIMLDPNEALHIGLAFHELLTDFVATELEEDISFISISSSLRQTENGQEAHVTWQHTRNAAACEKVAKSTKLDTMLEKIVPRAIDGHADIDRSSQNLRYTLTWLTASAQK